MQLHWRTASRFHDWFTDHCAIPRTFLARLRQVGVIGALDWISVGYGEERRPVAEGEDELERHLRGKLRRSTSQSFAAGGKAPHDWNLTLLLAPYLKSRGETRGYNLLNVWFDIGAFSGQDGSDLLAGTFQTVHSSEASEFGFIHPAARRGELADAITGQYGQPLTIGPMFAGVYWANYLGRQQLAFFDAAELQKLTGYEITWTGRDELYLRVCENVEDAVRPEVEAEMFRLTEAFRAAQR